MLNGAWAKNRVNAGIGLVVFWALSGLVLLRSDTLPRGEASVLIGERAFRLEVSETPAARRKGLAGRESLCDHCGMLFVFERPGRYAFTMEGMRFPLDILWLHEGRIVWIERSLAPEPRVWDPDVQADRVLELRAGAAEGVRPGDSVRITEIR
jgi:uncharacterized membrane protein (UPF0127 family)